MHVVLEVKTGPEAGRRIRLRTEQTVQVGRSGWADVALASDDRLADIHFGVRVSNNRCCICDLRTDSGTFVNGQRLVQGELRHGDEIVAGSTVFRVDAGGTVPAPVSPPAALAKPQFRYRQDTTPGGLTVYSGEEDAPTPGQMAGQLGEHLPLYLLASFDNLVLRRPPELENSRDYVTTNTNPAWLKFFPLLLGPLETSVSEDLLKQGWAEDAIACLFSHQSKQPLLTHLRAHAASFSGFDVLRKQLDCCPPGFVADRLQDVAAVMLKHPDGASWQLYVNPESGLSWQNLGFELPPYNEPEQTDAGD